MKYRLKLGFVAGGLFVMSYWLLVIPAFATEYSSTNFKVLDPVIDESGGESTSTSYRLHGALGEVAPARSTSSSFRVNAGSVAYPLATVPTLTATAGALQVVLSWTASSGALGWTISGYDVCTGTVTNTYTCENAGNVTTFTKSNLTAGTAYFFRVRGKDAFGNVVVRSNETSATPTAAAPSGGGGGGGGGGTVGAVAASVVMRGRAYPGVTITLLQNGMAIKTTTATLQGTFEGSIPDISSGVATFGVSARDLAGRTSILLTYTINIPSTATQVAVENIFIPPTVDLSSVSLKRGEVLKILGQAFPGSIVTIRITSTEMTRLVAADPVGAWLLDFDTSVLEEGAHLARAKAGVGTDESTFGAVRSFTITSVPTAQTQQCQGADINKDGMVNLVDMSVLLTFWKKTAISNACADLNGDGMVDLRDFSRLLFHWTG